MHVLDLTLPSPAKNLALDEALLHEAEAGGGEEVLRFWMSPEPFVVIGIGAKVEQEVRLPIATTQNIPVHRRCSGGGTVVQGPGCLNYSLILRILPDGPTSTITSTNSFVMKRNAAVLSEVLNRVATVEGHTDLAIEGTKVSGNAQRRLRHHLLFHGTFLLNFDLTLITTLLPTPTLQPPYRKDRAHTDFLMNLSASEETLKTALRDAWRASTETSAFPKQRVEELAAKRYDRTDWTFRR